MPYNFVSFADRWRTKQVVWYCRFAGVIPRQSAYELRPESITSLFALQDLHELHDDVLWKKAQLQTMN